MRAMLLDAPAPIEDEPLHLGEADQPVPGPGEIVIRVAACGVCRSNLPMVEGHWLDSGNPSVLPIIPGHEFVGTVTTIGEGVDAFATGQRAGVGPLWSTCGNCEARCSRSSSPRRQGRSESSVRRTRSKKRPTCWQS